MKLKTTLKTHFGTFSQKNYHPFSLSIVTNPSLIHTPNPSIEQIPPHLEHRLFAFGTTDPTFSIKFSLPRRRLITSLITSSDNRRELEKSLANNITKNPPGKLTLMSPRGLKQEEDEFLRDPGKNKSQINQTIRRPCTRIGKIFLKFMTVRFAIKFTYLFER